MKKKLFFALLIIFLGLFPFLSKALTVLPPCTASGNCGICDFLDTFMNIIRWVITFIGGAALLLMVWHGFGWITSFGNEEAIKKSRLGLLHTVLAIVIILAAWQIVNMVVVLLVSPAGTAKQTIFGRNWYQYCQGDPCTSRGDGYACGVGRFCFQKKCGNTADGVTYPTTCDYLNKGYTVNGNLPYQEYLCLDASACDPNKDLGSTYCDGQNHCCAVPKPSTTN